MKPVLHIDSENRSIITAMTGASGAAYGLRLIQRLAEAGVEQHLLLSKAARVVLKQEADIDLPEQTELATSVLAQHLNVSSQHLHNYALEDWFSPTASGSAGIKQMVIIPCSMGTMARIAGGMSDNLIERAADVILKEKRQLIIVPRETPLSSIHLENMLKLSHMGTHIIPAMPGFYHKPETIDEIIDFIVNRVLDHLNLCNPEAKKWGV